MKGHTVLMLFAVTVVGQALTPSTFFTNVDKERLRSLFKSVKPYGDDLQAIHYSVLGINLLGGTQEEPHKTCEAMQKYTKNDNLESVYYSSSASVILKAEKYKTDCKINWGNAEKMLGEAISGQSTTQKIYQAVSASKNLGYKVDNAKVATALEDALKKDDAPVSYGYAFYTAALVGGDLVNKYHSSIEDMIAQADEIDYKFLSFDGSLHTSAIVVDSSYKLAAAAKKAPTITEDQAIKFANYFISRKHAQSLKNAAVLLSVIKTFTNNQYHIPIAVTRASQISVSDKFSTVQVRVSNLLGQSLGNIAVTADTARHLGDDAVVLSKKQFKQASTDNTMFEYDFLQVKPARGFYKITVSVAPQQKDNRLIGLNGAEVEVKVTTQVGIEGVEIGVGDREQSSPPRTTKLQHPNKATNVLEADYHQKISMKFQLRDKSAHEIMTAHQTFVRLSHEKTGEEIIFVAEADNLNVYKFELDVGAKAKEFGHRSGKYNIDLVIGDAVIQNPFSWNVADVKLSFPESSAADEKHDPYQPKPEIKHMFREPEVRPSKTISTIFTGLVFLPILILLALWLKTGVNISNFPMSVSALGFHLGLGAIFGLYYMYWVQLSMFTTLRYLGIIGIPTFLFGNRLLSGIAAKRKQ